MYKNVLEEDLAFNAENTEIPYEELAGKTVLVTGATGLVGANLIRTLLYADSHKGYGIKVIAAVRNLEKAGGIFGDLMQCSGLTVKCIDLEKMKAEDFSEFGKISYIIHTAAVTTSRILVNNPVEAINSALFGTANILRLAKDLQCESVIYLSSMEMYGTVDLPVVKEENIGYIDIMKVRSNYPESKRMCENMCVAYHSEYGVPVKIARLSQTFGAGILPGENRVFAQFARSAMRGEDIVMHTEGKSEGNYCYLREAVSALLILLVRGNSGEAYNIVNEDTHTTIRDMAQMVCEKFSNGKSHVVFDIPESNTFGYAADVKMKLSSEKMRGLGWTPRINLEEAYERLIRSISEE